LTLRGEGNVKPILNAQIGVNGPPVPSAAGPARSLTCVIIVGSIRRGRFRAEASIALKVRRHDGLARQRSASGGEDARLTQAAPAMRVGRSPGAVIVAPSVRAHARQHAIDEHDKMLKDT
jgi:hypothetical protein